MVREKKSYTHILDKSKEKRKKICLEKWERKNKKKDWELKEILKRIKIKSEGKI